MFAEYAYNASSDRAQVFSDIRAILTGETNKANLSASCNQVGTTIIGTIPAGWTAWDDIDVYTTWFRAPLTDSGTQYKFGRVILDGSSRIYQQSAEDWDEVLHTGTNVVTNFSDYQPLNLTSGGTLIICASARFMAFLRITGGSIGDNNYSGCQGYFEFSRDQPWDTVAAGYPKGALVAMGPMINGLSQPSYVNRLKNKSNSDITLQSFKMGTICVDDAGFSNSNQFPAGADETVYDDTATARAPLWPIYMYDNAKVAAPLGEISSICDVWLPPRQYFTNLETFQIAAVDYVALQAASFGPAHAVFRKG